MIEHFRIRFNPVTKEIEIEGSEEFVKTYFDKLQGMISGASEIVREAPSVEQQIIPEKKARKESKAVETEAQEKSQEISKKKPVEKKMSNIDRVVSLIQGAPKGISTAELKEKAGLTNIQIWNIISRVTKEGRIRKVKKGLYGGVDV